MELYIQRAKLYLYNEQVGYAIRDINKALSLDRKNIDALLVLADIYYELGDENNILLTLNKANEYAPLDTRPIIKLAELSFYRAICRCHRLILIRRWNLTNTILRLIL